MWTRINNSHVVCFFFFFLYIYKEWLELLRSYKLLALIFLINYLIIPYVIKEEENHESVVGRLVGVPN